MRSRLLIIMLGLFVFMAGTLSAQDFSYWQDADAIRSLTLQAQAELLAARRAETPDDHYAVAADSIAQAQSLYASVLQAPYTAGAAEADAMIVAAFAEAETAAAQGDALRLAAASGRLKSALLWGSYVLALDSLQAEDVAATRDWLRLREYRQPTRVTPVDNQALRALDALEAGDIVLSTALLEVGDDLRDSYFFRAREALNETGDALEKDLPSRAAEWAGQAQAYFAILQTDFATKLGDESLPQLSTDLIALEAAVIDAPETAPALLDSIHQQIAAYQPVRLTSAEISERGAMLHMFTNLVYVEYKDAVRDGAIINGIEYAEASTFRDQAQTVFEELRSEIAAVDDTAALRLNSIFAELDSIITVHGPKSDVQALVDEAKTLVESSLTIDTSATNATAAFAIVDNLLDSMVDAVRAGRHEEAEALRIQAYAIFDSGPEPRLIAFAPDMITQVEGFFWQGYGDESGLAQLIAAEASVGQVIATRNQLDSVLASAKVIVGESASEPLAIMINAALIVFREGLEAVVILAALIAGMVGVNQRYRKPLLAGAGVALIVSIATWFLAQGILDLFRAYGEQLEAVVSLIAIAVLLLITNWFFHKVYWTQWIAGFHKQKRNLLGREVEIGQVLGLALLGFTSVYREGFETVLFLQALELEVGALTVLEGVLLGGLGVAIVGLLTFRMQRRLPYRKMLVWTGILIGVVLVTMVGHTAHVMQVLGWLPITPIRGVLLPSWLGIWFGTFATWQGILAQVSAVIFVLGSYFLAEHQASRRRSKPRDSAQVEASTPV